MVRTQQHDDVAPPPNSAPVVVSVRDVTKNFVVRKDDSLKERLVTLGRRGRRYREDFVALDSIAFDIQAGTTIGLIGHNGSGKSTLLKVIGGIIEPTAGQVWTRGRIAALLELGAGFHPDLTGKENIYLNGSILGLSRAEIDVRFDEIVEFADIGEFIDTPVKFYSSGMYVRLAFAVAVHTDPDILLVDEVLSVGDEAFQRKCMEKIRSFQEEGRTIILVTHNLGQVLDLCDRAVLLNHGHLVYDGPPREAISTFRDFLEGRRTDDTVRTQPGDSGTPVSVEANLIRPPGSVSRLEVKAHLWFSGSIPDWTFMVQVDSAAGQTLYSSRTGPNILKPLAGNRHMSVTFDDVRLTPGIYYVSVFALYANGGHVIDAIHSASFEVPGKPGLGGVVDVEAEFRDDDLSAPTD
jgi:ABC-2 type transport system ATP-binding protein